MKYMRRTAGYTWADYKTNSHIAKELEITPVLDKLLEYKRNWIQHVNRMPRDRLPTIMKHYSPTGRRNRGRLLKRLLDTWDRNGSTCGLTPWQTDIWWWWCTNNILKCSGFFTYHQVWHSKILHGARFLRCVFCADISTVSFALYINNWSVFITAVESVYSAVRTDTLYKADWV